MRKFKIKRTFIRRSTQFIKKYLNCQLFWWQKHLIFIILKKCRSFFLFLPNQLQGPATSITVKDDRARARTLRYYTWQGMIGLGPDTLLDHIWGDIRPHSAQDMSTNRSHIIHLNSSKSHILFFSVN